LREGILVKRPNAQGTVLICHGFMCNKTDTAFLRSLFDTFNVMTFDFRAHGESCKAEDCCTFGRDEAFDVMGAVRYLRSRSDLDFEHKPLIGYGFSMGAVAAIQAQAQNESLFDALVLDCPYDQSINIIKRGLDNLKLTFFGYTFDVPGKGLLEKYAFHPFVQGLLKQVLKSVAQMDATATNTVIYPLSPVESVKEIKVPCFFIHCKNDEKVGISAAKGLFQGAKGYKRLWLTAGRRHFDSFFFNPEKYAYKIKQFLSDVLTKDFEKKKQAKILEDVIVS
jgi:pimeloyl-ACP methyl ester carboxylesterase